MPAVVLPRADLPFPGSLPEFQRLFPDDTACAAYLEAIRWRDGFVCGWCGEASEPYRFANRAQVLRCRKCQRDNALTAGTVMERTRTPGEHPVSYGTDKLSLNLVLLGVNRISMDHSLMLLPELRVLPKNPSFVSFLGELFGCKLLTIC